MEGSNCTEIRMDYRINNKYLDNKTVFLAGATGLGGSSILKHIVKNHLSTKIRATYFKTKPFFQNKNINYVSGNLMSLKECRRMVNGCDCAIMAAAFTGGANLTSSQPWRHININLILNTVMLEAFYLEKIKRVVYIGSATLYQEFKGYIKENNLDMNKDPHPAFWGFGWVERFIEKLCRFYDERYEINILIARVSNIFGPYAKFDPKTSNFIPAIIRKAVDKMDPFEVWGTPDVTRDVIFSDDFARAIVTMANFSKLKFDIFNIGSGVKTTVGDIVEWALKYAGHKPSKINYIQNKPTTIPFRALDCTKAKKVLGWEPKYTVEEGVKKTTEWWIKNSSWWKK